MVRAARLRREGQAFALNALAIAAAVVLLFGGLFPDVMPSTTSDAYSLTVDYASSTPFTLRVMTCVSVPLLPVVLLYQGWTYWIFRRRIGTGDIPAHAGLSLRHPAETPPVPWPLGR